jgi:hypothetical protein
MKKLIYLLIPLLLYGCEKSYPTFPDIDGEYVIDQVVVLYEDQITGERWDSIHYSGYFELYKPLTPLDSFHIGITRLKFTNAGRTFMWNKDETVFGNPWRNSTESQIRQDILSGEWGYLQVHFLFDNMVTRVFELYTVGLSDFQVWVTQYPFKSEGPKINVRYHFKEVGP